jgi:hypothetical protein
MGDDMGYTHYFPQNREATVDEFNALCDDAEALIKTARDCGISIVDGLGDVGTLPTIIRIALDAPTSTSNESGLADIDSAEQRATPKILFNGEGENSCESFYITPFYEGFNFTKTRGLPYDAVVVAMLISMYYIAPGCWTISTDAEEPSQWERGIELWLKTFPDRTIKQGLGPIAGLIKGNRTGGGGANNETR